MCTIIAKNYIAFARTLCESFLEHHPEGECYVLVIDEHAGLINPADERFEVVKLQDLQLPNLRSLCFRYNVTELSTAVKPFLLEYLMREKALTRLLYLDPDILVTASLEPLYQHLAHADMVVTPHLDTDYPEDGLRPGDDHILRCGIFNLGFLGVNSGDNANSFLQWWKEKLLYKCVIDHARGYFVDQRFVDMAFTLFDTFYIEKDPGYNVAYWNLHSRFLSREGKAWKCNGAPLRFFHFSSFNAQDPNHISKYMTRHTLTDRTDLRDLFELYRQRLFENGHREAIAWDYTFGTFKSGKVISDELRAAYRNAPHLWKTGDPFSRSLKYWKKLVSVKSPPGDRLITIDTVLLKRWGIRSKIAGVTKARKTS